MISKKLLHLTFKEYGEKIKKSGFNQSIHIPTNRRIQWLGDGVYFYNNGDSAAVRQGKSLLLNKKNKPSNEVIGIRVDATFHSDNIFNILNQEDIKFLKKYIHKKSAYFHEQGNQDLNESYLDLIFVLEYIECFLPFDNEFYGKTLGSLINEFLLELVGNEIELVSCSFVTNRRFKGKANRAIEQHCVKQIKIISNCSLYQIVPL